MGIELCVDNILLAQGKAVQPKASKQKQQSEVLRELYCSCDEIIDSEYLERDDLQSSVSLQPTEVFGEVKEVANLPAVLQQHGILGDVERMVVKTNKLNNVLATANKEQVLKVLPDRIIPAFDKCFSFEDHGHVDITKDIATYYINFFCDEEVLNLTRFFVRWGCYDDVAENWEDLEIRCHEIVKIRNGHFYIRKIFPLLRRGWYGATCYAQDVRTEKQIWQGIGYHHDAKFRIDRDSELLGKHLIDARREYLHQLSESVLLKINDYRRFSDDLIEYSRGENGKYLPQVLFEATKHSENLRDLISGHFRTAQDKMSSLVVGSEEYLKSKFVSQTLNNIGVGEVVLVSPEGPQATFGGIAQVINGWLNSYAENGVATTLISLLYEQSQGNKHSDAGNVLRNGINIGGQKVRVKYCGEVDIPFGNGSQVRANVYLAERGKTRVFLLRHPRFADKLYPHLMGDEHLRRCIFLSRGALEVMKNFAFGIKPQIIISNDWISALVPVLHKLDQRYSCAENLYQARTIHVIHNSGKDYQGRVCTTHGNQNLFSMLELNSTHLDGLLDPHQKNMFNMTAAALTHLNGGVLSVSRPYTRELLTREGADGLDSLYWKHRDALFGISNGIEQERLRKDVMKIGEGARFDLGWGRTQPEESTDLKNYFDNLLGYKEAAKLRLQRNFGLQQGADKTIVSLTGMRLCEQKGIALLMGRAVGDNCSVMELILRKYPEVQLVIAGPHVDGDKLSSDFCGMANHLKNCFPGRVLFIADFIPHDFVMEIFTASDFTLMPSRFEPGGLTQIEALVAGTLVVARNVGGISATLERFDDVSGRGNGFMFDEYSSTALRNTICWAIDRTSDLDYRKSLMWQAAHAEHDWSHRAEKYFSVFQHILGVLGSNEYKHLQHRKDLIQNDVLA